MTVRIIFISRLHTAAPSTSDLMRGSLQRCCCSRQARRMPERTAKNRQPQPSAKHQGTSAWLRTGRLSRPDCRKAAAEDGDWPPSRGRSIEERCFPSSKKLTALDRGAAALLPPPPARKSPSRRLNSELRRRPSSKKSSSRRPPPRSSLGALLGRRASALPQSSSKPP